MVHRRSFAVRLAFALALFVAREARPASLTIFDQSDVSTAEVSPVKAEDETSPGGWVAQVGKDFAFVLFEDELFASDFEAGVTCAWSSVPGGSTCPI